MENESTATIDLSVIIPIYNVEEYLERCLDSVLSQGIQNMEIICVNDGSTDNCRNIIRSYAQKDSRIVAVEKQNGGLVSARKAGLKVSRGKYIIHIDSDDWIEQDMFQSMMTCAEKTDCDIVCTGIIRDYGNNLAYEYIHFDEGLYEGVPLNNTLKCNMVDERFMKYNLAPHLVTKMCRANLMKEKYNSIPDETNLDEDVISTYPMLLAAKKVYVLDKCFYHYCSRETSIINSVKKEETKRLKITYDYLKEEFGQYEHSIQNIMRQYTYLKTFAYLLSAPQEIISYNDGYFNLYGAVRPESKVIIYGTGSFCAPLKTYIEEHTNLRIVGLADARGDGKNILRPQDLKDCEFDYIIISVVLSEIVNLILADLEKEGISYEKIKFIYKEDSYESVD